MAFTEAYFIRHGIAVDRQAGIADEMRSLTPNGITKTQRVAQRLCDLGLQFDHLLTSPLTRARQTADILHTAGLSSPPEEFLPLQPGGDLLDWLTWLKARQTAVQTVALVGHEPDLSQWAQQLVTGSDRHQWILKKAGIIGLQIPNADQAIGQSQLFWLSPPRFLL
ncbi:MAG: phosphohistidine phosphatase SixA [Phormidesmis priestleyi]|uniref:Phosphohistidine phosphatase SixA n=1 Tax=Phormidesmis priestleyi TaxID=268141 RepID=A0A2W4XLP8_9CYAN|nr:MAG: phosphohistidine phosphatase SixA [Phormidesmis priestleyi]